MAQQGGATATSSGEQRGMGYPQWVAMTTKKVEAEIDVEKLANNRVAGYLCSTWALAVRKSIAQKNAMMPTTTKIKIMM